jgi:hypothetical protein
MSIINKKVYGLILCLKRLRPCNIAKIVLQEKIPNQLVNLHPCNNCFYNVFYGPENAALSGCVYPMIQTEYLNEHEKTHEPRGVFHPELPPICFAFVHCRGRYYEKGYDDGFLPLWMGGTFDP